MFICVHVDASVLQILLYVLKITSHYRFLLIDLNLSCRLIHITHSHYYFVHLATHWDMVQVYLK